MLYFSLLRCWWCTLGSKWSPHTWKNNTSRKPFGRSDATTLLEWENISACASQIKLHVYSFPASSKYSFSEAYQFAWLFLSVCSARETMASEEFSIVQHTWHCSSNWHFSHVYCCFWPGTQKWAETEFVLAFLQAESRSLFSCQSSPITGKADATILRKSFFHNDFLRH